MRVDYRLQASSWKQVHCKHFPQKAAPAGGERGLAEEAKERKIRTDSRTLPTWKSSRHAMIIFLDVQHLLVEGVNGRERDRRFFWQTLSKSWNVGKRNSFTSAWHIPMEAADPADLGFCKLHERTHQGPNSWNARISYDFYLLNRCISLYLLFLFFICFVYNC